MVRQAEAEQEVIQAGVVAAFGDGAPVVGVVVFGDECVIERPRLPASEGADALMAALDEREAGVRERVDQAGREAVDAGMRGDPWGVPIVEPPVFELATVGAGQLGDNSSRRPGVVAVSATGTDTAVAGGTLLLGGLLYLLGRSIGQSPNGRNASEVKSDSQDEASKSLDSKTSEDDPSGQPTDPKAPDPEEPPPPAP